MAIRSGLFNSVNGDRRYDAPWFAEYFATFIGNGVFPNPSTGLQVVEGTNMQTIVKPGKGWINGYYVVNDSDFILQHDIADGVLKRIDRIVLRLNYLARQIEVVVKKGAFASSPVAPPLQRDTDAYELALADVFIDNGITQITQANITDQRLNTALCGIVHGTVNQVDTTTIFNQYLSWFNQFSQNKATDFDTWQAQEKADFNAWFETIQDILSGDVAANLQNQIATLSGAVDTHMKDEVKHLTADERTSWNKAVTDIGTKTSLLTTNKTNLVNAVNELFTNVSNGKQLVGTAITDVDNSLVVPTESTFQNLADLIRSISPGKKVASGTVTVSSGASYNFVYQGNTNYYSSPLNAIVTGLDFVSVPSLILAYITDPGSSTNFFLSLFMKSDNIYNGVIRFASFSPTSISTTAKTYKQGSHITATSFRLPLEKSGLCYWIAVE